MHLEWDPGVHQGSRVDRGGAESLSRFTVAESLREGLDGSREGQRSPRKVEPPPTRQTDRQTGWPDREGDLRLELNR